MSASPAPQVTTVSNRLPRVTKVVWRRLLLHVLQPFGFAVDLFSPGVRTAIALSGYLVLANASGVSPRITVLRCRVHQPGRRSPASPITSARAPFLLT